MAYAFGMRTLPGSLPASNGPKPTLNPRDSGACDGPGKWLTPTTNKYLYLVQLDCAA
ncbi:hypothetical protein QUA40_02395 [Microcoleus sp. Pol11C3]|uniref:hypothetical protein n=1 Tax=Microcoleus sp. Pol11C3 TaxID=3055390 RepID=UPI002FD297F2